MTPARSGRTSATPTATATPTSCPATPPTGSRSCLSPTASRGRKSTAPSQRGISTCCRCSRIRRRKQPSCSRASSTGVTSASVASTPPTPGGCTLTCSG
ncbi:hypothetical protein BRC87_08345 [Halobacteriales archaeon QS_4_66_20]|nr:MAG: hypothetical protein BRC87_08345 [Halobacteriales archaeon QS_4_66_20]